MIFQWFILQFRPEKQSKTRKEKPKKMKKGKGAQSLPRLEPPQGKHLN